MSICQLQFTAKSILVTGFAAFLLSGCGSQPVLETKNDDRVIKASWLKLPLRFAHQDMDDQHLTHPFFDVDPAIAALPDGVLKTRFFVTTAEGSGFQYNLDLYSGRLYREREFCPQEDIWEFYRGKVERPNFTQGIVPRVFDETNSPQRVIILSDKNSVQPFKYHPTHYDDARIIGSIILEACESFPCDRADKWRQTQILVGVSAADSTREGITTFTKLKNSTDWSYVKAMLTNMYGTFSVGGKDYPAYRISRELNPKDTKSYFDKKATLVNMKKMEEWRIGCMKLYDELWTSAEKIRGQKNGQADSFLKLFKEFYAKNSDQFYGCQKLVRPANINEDYRRLWFMTFIQAFTNLEKNGFFYSCHDGAWAYNPKVDDTKFFNNQNNELARCRAKDFEKSFDQAINGLGLMKSQTNKMYRFVEYDNGRGGSHQKIYGWISGKTTNYTCVGAKRGSTLPPAEIFPQDVTWEHFKLDDDRTVR